MRPVKRTAKRRGPIQWGYRRSVGADLHAAAEARLAETLGWDLDVVRGRKPIDNRGGSGAFELIEPAGLDFAAPTFEVLRVAKWKRFGNSVRQLTNVFLVGERFGTKRIEFPEPHPFFLGRQAGRFQIACQPPLQFRRGLAGLVPGRPGLMGDFFIVSGLGLQPDPDDLARLVAQYVRPLLVDALRVPRSDVGDNDMVLHFRGGDVFVPSKRMPIHPGYGQPPAAYYLSAVERERPSQVWLVFEDHNNPCVGAVADGLKQRGVAFRMQSASLAEDLHLLLSAPCLVAGVGSFCKAVAALSTRLRKLFSFEWVEPTLSHLGVHAVVATDLPGDYRRLVTSDWQATSEQRALMLSYPADAIGFRDHPPVRRESMQGFDAIEGSP